LFEISGEKNEILHLKRSFGGAAPGGNGGPPDVVDLLQFSDKVVWFVGAMAPIGR
jgi:hypothetical protein